MSLSIQTNVDSILAQEHLRINSEFQSRTIQRVTSGYRINSSADDAAGLAVANKYRDDTTELTQGVRNANDGISTLQIVDGGLSNISQMLDRLKTLATESASATFSGDRTTLDTEYQTLLKEIDRQADNIGLGKNNAQYAQQIDVYTGGGSNLSNAKVTVDLSGGKVDSASLGIASTSILSGGLVNIGAAPATQIAAGSTETFTIITKSGTHVISITGGTGDTLDSQLQNLKGQLSVLGITASLDSSTGVLQFSSADAFNVSTNATAGLAAASLTGIQNGAFHNSILTGTAGTAGTVDLTYNGQTYTLNLGAGWSSATGAQSLNQQLASFGITDLQAIADPTAGSIDFQGKSAIAFSNFTGGLTSATADAAPTATGGSPSAAIAAIDAAVQKLGLVQGKVGTGENQLQYAINLAQSQIASFSAAESRIRDTDIAAEASNLTKAQVLQQASLAALAQANQAPQALLALLKG
jgi:flagellin-like hook-associated protein FlgL